MISIRRSAAPQTANTQNISRLLQDMNRGYGRELSLKEVFDGCKLLLEGQERYRGHPSRL